MNGDPQASVDRETDVGIKVSTNLKPSVHTTQSKTARMALAT